MKDPIIISYPRSGSNFILYCIENIFMIKDIPKTHCQNKEFWENLDDKLSAYVIGNNRTHDRIKIVDNDLPVIFIIRNYKECIPRQTNEYFFGDKFISALSNTKTSGKIHHFDYISPLYFYDQCKNDKIIIYYEDFIENIEAQLKLLCDFIKVSCNIEYNKNQFDDFIRDIEYHKKESIDRYKKHSKSVTEGKSILYHSCKIDKKEIKKIDEYLIKKYPLIVIKYLNRYLEKDKINTKIRFLSINRKKN